MYWYAILVCLCYFLFLVVGTHVINNMEYFLYKLLARTGNMVVAREYRDKLDDGDWKAIISSTGLLFIAVTVLSIMYHI